MTVPKKRDFRSACLWLTLLIGVGCIVWGISLDSLLPCDVSQAALTPEEKADETFRKRVWEILELAAFHQAFDWCAVGLILIGVSAFGLGTAPKEAKESMEPRETPVDRPDAIG